MRWGTALFVRFPTASTFRARSIQTPIVPRRPSHLVFGTPSLKRFNPTDFKERPSRSATSWSGSVPSRATPVEMPVREPTVARFSGLVTFLLKSIGAVLFVGLLRVTTQPLS
jgi:hypothetical protein